MKKFHPLSLCFFLFSLSLGAQSHFRAPLSPDFIQQSERKGYINPPHKVKHQTVLNKSSELLPSSFDLRDVDGENFLPAIEDQGAFGTCWSFAALASVESNWKVMGDADFTNLSESHMATCHGYVFTYDEGGNEYTSTAYLSRLAGPVYESSVPYQNLYADTTCVAVDKNIDIPAYINNVLWLGNDQDLAKQMLMQYGALATSMKADFSSHYYNSEDYTFYYNGTEIADHGVAIIGWDDDKVVTGGSDATPSEPGAWIIRNSWGDEANDQGYFYASYEDVHIGRASELYYGKTLVSDIDTIFDYAPLGAITSYSAEELGEVAYAAVKYTADRDYFITHVGSAILAEATSLDITICKSFDGQNFSDTIAHRSDIFCNYAGYQKIEFPALINEGDFYLITRYYTPNEYYPLPAETVIETYSYPVIEEGKMWVSNDAYTWTAGGAGTDFDFDLAVKVIAQEPDVVQAYFMANKSTACIDQSVTFENKTLGLADSFYWYFEDDTIITYDSSQSVQKSFATTGLKDVRLEAYSEGLVYDFSSQAVEVVSDIYPQISIVDADDYYSRGKPITLIGNGGETYRWYADNYLDGEEGRIITFSPEEEELWVKLEVSLGNCSATDSILIRTIEVPYDDIADALFLNINETYTQIDNSYATVQDLEPLPELGSCESQITWCEEGGLQNSLWFKFNAPASGKVEINTSGFDNQIALYDALETGGWEDILSGDTSKYQLLAANDDYYSEDYAAKITEVSDLTYNKTYWIQMDGSGGGSSGLASITVSDTEATSLSYIQEQSYVFIQDADGMRILTDLISDLEVRIYNSTGILVLSTVINGDYTLAPAQLVPGIYFIALSDASTRHIEKAVVDSQWQLKIQER